MQAFTLTRPSTAGAAIVAASQPNSKYIAGGTDLLQLTKDNVEAPVQLVDLDRVDMADIRATTAGLRLEPLARMSDVAAHPDVVKQVG